MGKYDALINDLVYERNCTKDELASNDGTIGDDFYTGVLVGIEIALCCVKRHETLEGEKTNAR